MRYPTLSRPIKLMSSKASVPNEEKLRRFHLAMAGYKMRSTISKKRLSNSRLGQSEVSEPGANDDKTVLTVIDRPGPKNTKAQHINNGVKAGPLFWVMGGVAMVVGLFWLLGKFATSPDGGANFQRTPSIVAGDGARLIVAVTAPGPLSVGPSPAPTLVIPSPAPTNTATLVPSPTVTNTPRADVLLSVTSYWPKSGVWPNGAKTKSGALPITVEGRGAACPEVFPLGTELRLYSGQTLVCVDRGKLTCAGGTCQVVLYARTALTGLIPAWIRYPGLTFDNPQNSQNIPK